MIKGNILQCIPYAVDEVLPGDGRHGGTPVCLNAR
jgi:hypothetical protein